MKKIKIAFRLLAVVPPLIGAAVVSNLDKIMAMAGLIGFGIAFFVPALLALAARRRCIQLFGQKFADTPYRGRLTFQFSEYIVCVVFGAAAIYVATTVVMSWF